MNSSAVPSRLYTYASYMMRVACNNLCLQLKDRNSVRSVLLPVDWTELLARSNMIYLLSKPLKHFIFESARIQSLPGNRILWHIISPIMHPTDHKSTISVTAQGEGEGEKKDGGRRKKKQKRERKRCQWIRVNSQVQAEPGKGEVSMKKKTRGAQGSAEWLSDH